MPESSSYLPLISSIKHYLGRNRPVVLPNFPNDEVVSRPLQINVAMGGEFLPVPAYTEAVVNAPSGISRSYKQGSMLLGETGTYTICYVDMRQHTTQISGIQARSRDSLTVTLSVDVTWQVGNPVALVYIDRAVAQLRQQVSAAAQNYILVHEFAELVPTPDTRALPEAEIAAALLREMQASAALSSFRFISLKVRDRHGDPNLADQFQAVQAQRAHERAALQAKIQELQQQLDVTRAQMQTRIQELEMQPGVARAEQQTKIQELQMQLDMTRAQMQARIQELEMQPKVSRAEQEVRIRELEKELALTRQELKLEQEKTNLATQQEWTRNAPELVGAELEARVAKITFTARQQAIELKNQANQQALNQERVLATINLCIEALRAYAEMYKSGYPANLSQETGKQPISGNMPELLDAIVRIAPRLDIDEHTEPENEIIPAVRLRGRR